MLVSLNEIFLHFLRGRKEASIRAASVFRVEQIYSQISSLISTATRILAKFH